MAGSVFSTPSRFANPALARRSSSIGGFSGGSTDSLLQAIEQSRRTQEQIAGLSADPMQQAQALNAQLEAPGTREAVGLEEETPDFSIMDILLGGLQAPLDVVKNTAEGLGELALSPFTEGADVPDALRAFGRAAGSALNVLTPGLPLETALEQLGIGDDIQRFLAPQSGIGTGTSTNRIFGSSIRPRDVASEIGELAGQTSTNFDPEGAWNSEYGDSLLQDALTGGLTALEIVGDPVNFMLPGAGAMAKGLKTGAKLAGAARSTASRMAVGELGLAEELANAGIEAHRLNTDNIGAALRTIGKSEHESFDIINRYNDLYRPTLDKLLAGNEESADLFRRFGTKEVQPLVDEAVQVQQQIRSKSFIPRETFRAQQEAGQRTLFSGPYGAVLKMALPEQTIRKIDSNYIGFLTDLNAAAGAGTALFKPADKTLQLMRAAAAAGRPFEITPKQVEGVKNAIAAVANAMPKEEIAKRYDGLLGKLRYGQVKLLEKGAKVVRPIVLGDAETPQATYLRLMAESARSSVGYVQAIAERPGIAGLVNAIEEFKAKQPELERTMDEFNNAIIAEVEHKALRDAGADVPTNAFDLLVLRAATSVDDVNQMRLAIQRASGVNIDELVDEIGYYGRMVKPEYRDIMKESYFKNAVRKAKAAGIGIGRGEAAKGRLAVGIDFKEVNEFMRKELGDKVPDGTNIFEDDVLKALEKQGRSAQDRIVSARMANEMFTTFGTGLVPEMVGGIAKRIIDANPNWSSLSDLQRTRYVAEALVEQRGGKVADKILKNLEAERSRLEADVSQAKAEGRSAKVVKKLETELDGIKTRIEAASLSDNIARFSSEPANARMSAARRIAGKKLGSAVDNEMVDGLTFFSKMGDIAMPRDAESLVQLAMTRVPKEVLDDFEAVFELMPKKDAKGALAGMLKAADEFVGFFRTALLADPISISNDIAGNVIMGSILGKQWKNPGLSFKAMQAFGAAAKARGMTGKVLSKLGSDFKDQTIKTIDGEVSMLKEIDSLMESGVLSRAATIAAESGSRTKGPVSAKLSRATGERSEKVGQFFEGMVGIRATTENMMKAAQYVHNRAAGMSVDDAVSNMQKLFFNYNDVTKIERDKLRRWMLFYTWAKKAIPLALRTSVEDPINFKIMMMLTGAAANRDRDTEDWVKRLNGHYVGTDQVGNPKLLSLGNTVFDPTTDTLEGNVLLNVARSLSPVAKIPLEMAMKRDLFTGKPIALFGENMEEEMQGRTANHAPSILRYTPQSVQDYLGFVPKEKDGRVVGYTMASDKRFLLENVLGMGSVLRTAGVVGASDERKTALDRAGAFFGARAISVPQLREDGKMLTEIDKMQDALVEAVNNLSGKPLIFSYGRVLPNKATPKGAALAEQLDAAKDTASTMARQRGWSAEQRAAELDRVEELIMGKYWPKYGALKQLLEQTSEMRDYLRDPEAFQKKRDKRRNDLIEEDRRRRVKMALGLR